MAVIYLLTDPRNNCPKYVGYTTNLANRMHYHYRPPRFNSYGKRHSSTHPWLAELADVGLLPVSKILETIPDGVDWQSRERFWISHYRERYPELLNVEDGGLGGKSNRLRASPQKLAIWNQKISEGKKKEWENKTPEEKERLLDNGARKGFKMMRPKTRDWRGRYNGAMDIPTDTLFDL
jgi:hypothetical protein